MSQLVRKWKFKLNRTILNLSMCFRMLSWIFDFQYHALEICGCISLRLTSLRNSDGKLSMSRCVHLRIWNLLTLGELLLAVNSDKSLCIQAFADQLLDDQSLRSQISHRLSRFKWHGRENIDRAVYNRHNFGTSFHHLSRLGKCAQDAQIRELQNCSLLSIN